MKPIKKFCVDCKYCATNSDNPEASRCGHPALISPVTGAATLLCSTERSGTSGSVYPCGKSGDLFEAKEAQ